MSDVVALRAARVDDAERLYAWANDPVARSASAQGEPIAWDTHLAWLTTVLVNERRHLYVAERAGAPVGTARLDRADDEPHVAVVSLNIAPEARGRGVGRALLAALTAEARALGYARLRAFVKASNEASARAFLATGYALVGDAALGGAAAQRYELAL